MWENQAVPRSHTLLSKNPGAKGRLPSYELLSKEFPQVCQTIQAISTTIGCLLELLVGKSQMLDPNGLVTGYREINLIGKLPPAG